MVSPLSSRIFNLEAKAKIKTSATAAVNAKIPWHIENRRKRISGYTADGESRSHSVNAEKQLRADQVEANAKKRKVEESNFQAYNVKNDLANAGIKYSPRSRALPVGMIDMSKVELIMSSKYQPDYLSQNNTDNQDSTFMDYNAELFSSMISETRHFYNGKQKKFRSSQRLAKKADSVTSSTTMNTSPSESPFDSDSEDEKAPIVDALLPGLVEKVEEYKITSTVSKMCSASEGKLIELGTALMSCNTPRLIIEAKAPYCIVHSNAAFSQLSEIDNDQLAGSSVATFINDSDKNNDQVDIISRPGASILTKDSNEEKKAGVTCGFQVFQVLSNKEVTHYVIDFEKDDESNVPGETSASEEELKVEARAFSTVG